MSEFYLLDGALVKSYLNMAQLIPEIEKAYLLKARKRGGVFPVITHDWIVGLKDMDIKSGYIDGDVNIYGLKALTYIDDNRQRNLPCLTGTMMVFSSETGQLRGILDSSEITGFRTGAAGGIGSKYLARPDSRSLLLVGAGKQAFNNLAANLLVMERLDRVMVCDPADPEGADRFVSGLKERLCREMFAEGPQPDLNFACETVAVEELGQATAQADIIVTVTPSRSPIIQSEWVRPGTHLNCIGSDMEGKEEVEKELFARARVVVDDVFQATTIGETEIPVKSGVIRVEDIAGEIGQVIDGSVLGRTAADQITIFDTSGLALQDLITAEYLIEKAKAAGLQKYSL